ncbi:MAG: hypothetical protein ACRCV6_01780 [Formosimonas sp.]
MDAIFKWLNLGLTALLLVLELFLSYDFFLGQSRGDGLLQLIIMFLALLLLVQVLLSLAFCYRWRVRWALQIMVLVVLMVSAAPKNWF